jgi:hypothetical protein
MLGYTTINKLLIQVQYLPENYISKQNQEGLKTSYIKKYSIKKIPFGFSQMQSAQMMK